MVCDSRNDTVVTTSRRSRTALGLLIAYSKRLDLLFGLISAVERLWGSDVCESDGARSVFSEQAPRVWRVSDRLSETDVQRLIFCYRDGALLRELASQFKISMNSVKRLLREHKARRKNRAVAGSSH